MRVREVTAVIKLSTEIGGAWRTLELGAVGTIDVNEESWEDAQRGLYDQLRQQFATLWAKGEKGKKEACDDQKLPFEEDSEPRRQQSNQQKDQPQNRQQNSNGNRQGGQGSGNQSNQSTHYCDDHAIERKVRENGSSGVAFWSHKIPDNKGGGWCNQDADGNVQVTGQNR